MDGKYFDVLARSLASGVSRRRLLKGLIGSMGGTLLGFGTSGHSPAGMTAAPASTPIELDYIALGDSIASGHGLTDENGTACQPSPSCCHRSSLSYPNRVVKLLYQTGRYSKVNFSHLACSGSSSSSLRGQVDQALQLIQATPVDRPVLVSITIGVNDFGWSDPATFQKWLYQEQDRTFHYWVFTKSSEIKSNVGTEIKRLMSSNRNVGVVVTEYFNPFNRDSVFFKFGPSGFCGIRDCFSRTEFALDVLNSSLRDAVNSIRLPKRVTMVTGIRSDFVGHASPKPTCGSQPPAVGDTFVQYRNDPNSNSYPPSIPWYIGTPLDGEWRGDCFHPNSAGAVAIAHRVVLAVSSGLDLTPAPSVPSSGKPKITSGPTATVTTTSAAISWTTDQPTNGTVEYGLTSKYGQSVSEPSPSLQTTHSLTIASLKPKTTYHYRIRSTNQNGSAETKKDRTFTILGCAADQTICSGGCIDTSADSANCGGCGHRCADGMACVKSQCAPICPAGQTACSGACVDTSSDPNNCGQCNHPCAQDEICADSQCTPKSCPAGQTLCGGSCTDTKTDRANCGACGNACGPDEGCCTANELSPEVAYGTCVGQTATRIPIQLVAGGQYHIYRWMGYCNGVCTVMLCSAMRLGPAAAA